MWLLSAQGALGACFHFITNGEVAVKVTEPDGSVRELFHRFRGQVVGEFGMMQGKRRTASVVCITKCSVRHPRCGRLRCVGCVFREVPHAVSVIR